MLPHSLRCHAHASAPQRQQRCALGQQQGLKPPCCHWVPTHGSEPRRARGSVQRFSTIGKLNIQPLNLPAEARQLSEAAAGGAAGLHIPPLDAWGQDAFLMSGCEPESAPLRLAVLFSGGVDSSLALKLVTAAGHQATAFYLQIWFQEDFRNFWDACPWEEDLSYAQQVCDALGVPLVVVPLTQQYWDRVVAHSVAEIKEGRTPNPDMLCNSRVKFGAFVEYLQQEHAGSFDRIASGHYAKVTRSHSEQPAAAAAGTQLEQDTAGWNSSSSSNGSSSGSSEHTGGVDSALQERQASHAQASSSSGSSSSSSGGGGGASPASSAAARLLMVPDAVKDQTYFLASLSASQLSRCLFPLGSFTKPQVRALAAAAGLATSGRKDSQGICFLGKVKFGEFVAQHLGEWPGPLVEEDTGQVVGVHDGYWFYTVGQRGGIKLPGGPWYVTRKDMAANTVYVSRTYYEREHWRDAFVCGPFNWLGPRRPHAGSGSPLMVKVRHGPGMYECRCQLGSREEVLALLEQGTPQTYQTPRPAGASASSGSGSKGSNDSSAGALMVEQQEQPSSSAAAAAADGGLLQSYAAAQQEPLYGVVLLSGNDQGLAAGQYAVFYQDQECLGSAQIMGSLAGARASS